MFGAAQPAATAKPLFGAAPATTTAAAPLFGAAPAASTTTSLFGAPAATTAAPSLFGTPSSSAAAAPAAGGLFGTTATTTTAAPSLFGTTPAASTASTGLFGTTASTSAAPSLFGSTATTTAPKTGLFGSPAIGASLIIGDNQSFSPGESSDSHAPAAVGGTSLFGTAATAAPAVSIGLGGAASAATTIGGIAGISGGLGAGGSDVKQETQVENVKEAKVEQPQLDLLAAVKNAVAENKKYADEFACKSSDACMKIEDRVRQLQRRISSISVSSSSLAANEEKLRTRTIRDLRLGQVATSIQDNVARNVYSSSNQGRMYMIQLIREYNDLLAQYAQTIEELQQRVLQLQNGTSSISDKDISDHLSRFDLIFSHVAGQIVATKDKISDLKDVFNEEHPGVLARETAYSSVHPSSSSGSVHYAAAAAASAARRMAGEPALPSQATALQIGQYIRQSGPAPAATGGLFGATTTTGGGLFGAASTAAKPFSFATPATATTGSLFGTATTTAPATTSLFGSPATPAATSSLSFGKPTIANSSSGLLFSSAPAPTKSLFGK